MIKVNSADFSKEDLENTVNTLKNLQGGNLKEQVTKYFEEFDTDKNGHLDRAEWPEFLKKFFATYKIETPLTEEYVERAFNDIDLNKDNLVQPDELEAFTQHYVKEILPQFETALSQKWFICFDLQRTV